MMHGHLNVKEDTCVYCAVRTGSLNKMDQMKSLMVYVIQVCCVYSEKLLMMDRVTVRNM